jgi:hypothetical protein
VLTKENAAAITSATVPAYATIIAVSAPVKGEVTKLVEATDGFTGADLAPVVNDGKNLR